MPVNKNVLILYLVSILALTIFLFIYGKSYYAAFSIWIMLGGLKDIFSYTIFLLPLAIVLYFLLPLLVFLYVKFKKK